MADDTIIFWFAKSNHAGIGIPISFMEESSVPLQMLPSILVHHAGIGTSLYISFKNHHY